MTATAERGAYGGSASDKQRLLREARSEWLEHPTDGLNLLVRNEKAQAWSLRAGLSPSAVQLALRLCPDGASAADSLGALLLAIRHGAQCDAVASAWWLWLWEQGDVSASKPLRDIPGPPDNVALAEQVNEMHRRVVTGRAVARADWRRIRSALPEELPGGLAVVAAAAWDFRAAPRVVVDVVEAWKQARWLLRQNDAGLSASAIEAMGSRPEAHMDAYLEGALGRPAPAEDDETDEAHQWRQAAEAPSQKFLDSHDDPMYVRWRHLQSTFEAEFRALTVSAWNALTRLLAQA